MDFRKMYADYVRAEIAKNANPYPTGVQAFQAGVVAERERIIALLETEMCEAYGENCENNPHCTARNRVIALIKGENK